MDSGSGPGRGGTGFPAAKRGEMTEKIPAYVRRKHPVKPRDIQQFLKGRAQQGSRIDCSHARAWIIDRAPRRNFFILIAV